VIIELSMCEADRSDLGGPEWLRLDTDRVLDTPGGTLIRWEAETRYPVERALGDALSSNHPPAAAVLVLLWLARKQGGVDAGGQDDDGRPESYTRLAQVKTLRTRIRSAREPEPTVEDDAVPPETSPAP